MSNRKQEQAKEPEDRDRSTETQTGQQREETADPITRLQRELGNQAIQRMATSAGNTGGSSAAGGKTAGGGTGGTSGAGGASVGKTETQASESGGPGTASSTRTGQTGNGGIPIMPADGHHEREAEAIASRIVGNRWRTVPRLSVTPSHDRSPGSDSADREVAPASVTDAISSPGRVPDSPVVGQMESALGADLGSVRVHTGPRAAESARAVGARAYTVGTDIVFDSGEYAPDTPSGRYTLAHELTHVAQQSGAADTVQRDTRRERYKEDMRRDLMRPLEELTEGETWLRALKNIPDQLKDGAEVLLPHYLRHLL